MLSMRVLHLGKYYWPFHGGLENVTRILAEGTGEGGHRVSVLVHGERGCDGEINGVRVRRAWSPLRLIHAPLAPLFLLDLHQLVRAERPHLLHVHLPNLSAFFLLLYPPAWRRPWILHWHADVVFGSDERLAAILYRYCYRPLEWLLLRRAAAIVVTSPPYLASSVPLRGFQRKCQVIPLPAPLPEASADRAVRWPQGELRVLLVGRLSAYKGHRILLDAIEQLRERGVSVAAVLVGSGDLEQSIAESVHARGLQDSVNLEGAIDDAALAAFYEGCDLLCLPSLDRAEAFGVVLLEAMSHGKPVVASDLRDSGVGWVVEEDVTGWKFPVGDSGALAERLAWCAGHRDALASCGEAARRRLCERFDRRRIVEEFADLYERVLDAGTEGGNAG
jgi:rhamnosyl/mannosyltransferase